MLKREWLFEKQSFVVITVIGVALFGLSCVLLLNNFGNPKLVRTLAMPLPSLLIFVVLKYVFFKLFNRNPVDTFWSMDFREMTDRIFNFLFWVLGIVLPALFAYKVLLIK